MTKLIFLFGAEKHLHKFSELNPSKTSKLLTFYEIISYIIKSYTKMDDIKVSKGICTWIHGNTKCFSQARGSNKS